jgi:hypothetical protein
MNEMDENNIKRTIASADFETSAWKVEVDPTRKLAENEFDVIVIGEELQDWHVQHYSRNGVTGLSF